MTMTLRPRRLSAGALPQALAAVSARFAASPLPAALGAAAAGASFLAPRRPGEPAGRREIGELERRLLQRATLGWTRAAQDAVERSGYEAWLEAQLHPESLDDGGLEDLLTEALPTLAMSPAERLVRFHDQPEVPFVELLAATVLRSIYSPRQLLERMVLFWTDHFNIHFLSDFGIFLKPTDDREVIRRHALGRFPELLAASAHSPAMLDYLTNDSNVRGHPNENYARELMELHTLGADGGFTQEDVREVARCFTGWTFGRPQAGPRFGRFQFVPELHDPGVKRVLGRRIRSGGGERDGEQVLGILASQPVTARFLSQKLLRWLWGYEPPERLVERLAAVYQDTGGDLRALLREALSRPFLALATPKLKRPYHLVVSTARALAAEIGDLGFLLQAMLAAGQLPFAWGPPNGYPDSAGYWSGFVLPRWNFAAEVFTGPRPALSPTLPGYEPGRRAGALATALDAALTGGRMSAATRGSLESFLAAGRRDRAHLAEALGLAVSAPEIQEY